MQDKDIISQIKARVKKRFSVYMQELIENILKERVDKLN